MVIARDVVNLNQAILVPEGTVLTALHLRRLRMWGIGSVEVKAASDEADTAGQPGGGIAPELLQAAEQEVNRRLKHVSDEGGAVAALRRLAISQAAQRLARETPAPKGGNP